MQIHGSILKRTLAYTSLGHRRCGAEHSRCPQIPQDDTPRSTPAYEALPWTGLSHHCAARGLAQWRWGHKAGPSDQELPRIPQQSLLGLRSEMAPLKSGSGLQHYLRPCDSFPQHQKPMASHVDPFRNGFACVFRCPRPIQKA